MRARAFGLVLALLLACGPAEGTRRPLRRTYEDGSLRCEGSEVLQDGEWTMDGPIVFYRRDGSKEAEGQYEGGLETGAWTHWLEDGTRAEGAFAEGRREGPWTYWHASGTKQEEGRYEKGQRVGRWKLWHPSGALREENDYASGQMHGERRVYREDGTLDRGRSGVFAQGERIGPLPRSDPAPSDPKEPSGPK